MLYKRFKATYKTRCYDYVYDANTERNKPLSLEPASPGFCYVPSQSKDSSLGQQNQLSMISTGLGSLNQASSAGPTGIS